MRRLPNDGAGLPGDPGGHPACVSAAGVRSETARAGATTRQALLDRRRTGSGDEEALWSGRARGARGARRRMSAASAPGARGGDGPVRGCPPLESPFRRADGGGFPPAPRLRAAGDRSEVTGQVPPRTAPRFAGGGPTERDDPKDPPLRRQTLVPDRGRNRRLDVRPDAPKSCRGRALAASGKSAAPGTPWSALARKAFTVLTVGLISGVGVVIGEAAFAGLVFSGRLAPTSPRAS